MRLLVSVTLSLLSLLPCISSQITSVTPTVTFPDVLSAYDVVRDAFGNVFVISQGGNAVVQYTADGTKGSTYGISGFLNSPNGIALDSTGNMYIADSSNNRILKASSTGVYIGVFTTNTPSLSSPTRVEVDGAGNMYIADYLNARMVKLNAAGVTQLVITGSPGPAMSRAFDVGLDPLGNIYILDDVGLRVRKFNSAGVEFTINGFPIVLPNSVYRGLAIDQHGNVYVSDNSAKQIRRYDAAGQLAYIFEDLGSSPHGLFIPADSDTQLYVANQAGNQARRYAVPATIFGDPQFVGFQGQEFQFHGLVDEHFNLISYPSFQMNSHFVYLASGGVCNYKHTTCWQHPGTYLDQIGIMIPTVQGGHIAVKMVAGTHQHGLRVWMSHALNDTDSDMWKGSALASNQSLMSWQMNTNGDMASVQLHEHHSVTVKTPTFSIKIINSDLFVNLEIALLDARILRAGQQHHTITDHRLCETQHQHQSNNMKQGTYHDRIQQRLVQAYPVHFPLEGLLGGTWRHVSICSQSYVGSVQDYVTSGLFAHDYYYQHYQY